MICDALVRRRLCLDVPPPRTVYTMPDLDFLQRELMFGVTTQHLIIGAAVLFIVLRVWNRIARANMKLPGK